MRPYDRQWAFGLAEPDVCRQGGIGDVRVDAVGFIKSQLAQPVEAEPAAALPAGGFGDATLLAIHHLFKARDAVGDGVLAQLDADVTPAHLMRNSSRGSGAEKGVEHKVARVG